MSIVLTAAPPDDNGRVLSVRLVTTKAELHAAQRLRHKIYVEDMGILPPDHPYAVDGRLVDPYDDWSSNLILLEDEEVVGTVRVTEAIDGPLELSEYIEVAPHLPAGARPAELTRYMVERRLRRGVSGPLLLYAAFKVIGTSRSTHLIAASKVGSLGRYYGAAGLHVVREEPFTYGLTGCRYQLGAMHIGGPGSLHRWRKWLWFGGLRLAAQRVHAVAHLFFRRRLRPDEGRPSVKVGARARG